MIVLSNYIIDNLKNLDIPKGEIKTEKDFENFVYKKLDNLLTNYKKNIILRRQETSHQEEHQLTPDIVVGLNEILIELKYDIKGNNDIYRLFYQAVKYSKIAEQLLILFVFDPQKKLSKEDIHDLENIKNVKVIRAI